MPSSMAPGSRRSQSMFGRGQRRCVEVRPSQAKRVNFFGPTLVYTRSSGRKMNHPIEDHDQSQFANGEGSRDLRVSSDDAEPETQLPFRDLHDPTDSRDAFEALRKNSYG